MNARPLKIVSGFAQCGLFFNMMRGASRPLLAALIGVALGLVTPAAALAQQTFSLRYVATLPGQVTVAATFPEGDALVISKNDQSEFFLSMFDVNGDPSWTIDIGLSQPSLLKASDGQPVLHFNTDTQPNYLVGRDGTLSLPPIDFSPALDTEGTAPDGMDTAIAVDRGDGVGVTGVGATWFYSCCEATGDPQEYLLAPARFGGYPVFSQYANTIISYRRSAGILSAPSLRQGQNLAVYARFTDVFLDEAGGYEIWRSIPNQWPTRILTLSAGIASVPIEVSPGVLLGTIGNDVYRANSDGSGYTLIAHVTGSNPKLVQDPNGVLWVTAQQGAAVALFNIDVDGNMTQAGTLFGAGQLLFGSHGIWSVSGDHIDLAVPTVFGASADDVLLYSSSSGQWTATAGLDGSFAEVSSGVWASGWTIQSGDFNDDGIRDLLLYNPVNGQFFKALGQGNGQFDFFGYFWAPGWTPTVIDFDGDGRSDVFLYNAATGDWFQCFSVGDGRGDFNYVPGRWAPGWSITKADWNADGLGDLFLYNQANGDWFQVTTLADGSFSYSAPGRWAPGWSIFPADFNGDKRTDLFLYNASSGLNFVVISDNEPFSYVQGTTWAPGWNVTILDLDQDGRSDVFVYNPTDGMWFDVFVSATDFSYSYAGGLWAAGWTIVPQNGYGAPSLLLYNPSNGQWFRATPDGNGLFTFVGDNGWPTGMTLVPLNR